MPDDVKTLTEEVAKRRWVAQTAAAQAPVEKSPRVLFVKNAQFFAKRDQKGVPLEEFSDKMLEQAQEKYERILVCSLPHPFFPALEGKAKVVVIPIDRKAVFACVQLVLTHLANLGIVLRLPKDRRTVSPLNLQNYVTDKAVVFADDNSYEVSGIEPEKPPSFQDIAKVRSRQSWP